MLVLLLINSSKILNCIESNSEVRVGIGLSLHDILSLLENSRDLFSSIYQMCLSGHEDTAISNLSFPSCQDAYTSKITVSAPSLSVIIWHCICSGSLSASVCVKMFLPICQHSQVEELGPVCSELWL